MCSLVGNDVFTDIEMFTCYDPNNSDTVMNVFTDSIFSLSSKTVIEDWLMHPKHEMGDLCQIQKNLQMFESPYQQNRIELNTLRVLIRQHEPFIQFFLHPPKKEIVSILDFVYFKIPILVYLRFNTIGSLLTCNNTYSVVVAPLLSVLSPLLYVMIPYCILVFKFKLKIPIYSFLRVIYKSVTSFPIQTRTFIFTKAISTIVSVALYLHGIQTTLFFAKNSYKVCTHLLKNLEGFYAYVAHCKTVCKLCDQSMDLPKSLENFIELGSNTTLFNIGKKLAWYDSYSMNEMNTFSKHMDRIFARISVVKLRNDRGLCYTKFLEQSDTTLDMKGCGHILIPNGVTNDICLTNSGCMITGPNAAGKSTFLKSILVNILLSQSLGMCCATHCELTPFYFINSQINIPDTKGVESLFEAEMHRCKYNLDIIRELPNDRKSVLVMDELFNSTNVVEGVSGAYAILSKLTTFKNTMTLLTTHFPYLTKLKSFSRYKFDATVVSNDPSVLEESDTDRIQYTYKMKPGVSQQYIALDILKKNFDSDVIDIAQTIKNKLLV